jgi:hypothetical protein
LRKRQNSVLQNLPHRPLKLLETSFQLQDHLCLYQDGASLPAAGWH